MTCFILINLLLAPAVRASCLSARKSTDPYIVCGGGLSDADAGWPTNYGPNNYTSVISLCSAANGNPGNNVGCICTSIGGQLHCKANIADPNLYNALPLNTGETLPEFCVGSCYCQSQFQSVEIPNYLGNITSPFDRGPPVSENEGADGTTATNNTTDDGPNLFANTPNNGLYPEYQNQCGNYCSSNADCTGESDCTCQTQSSQVVPGAGSGVGTVQYVAACIIVLSAAGGGKREEAWSWPCPCNGTYVSHACCEAADGSVWKSWENKLGVLAGEGEM